MELRDLLCRLAIIQKVRITEERIKEADPAWPDINLIETVNLYEGDAWVALATMPEMMNYKILYIYTENDLMIIRCKNQEAKHDIYKQ